MTEVSKRLRDAILTLTAERDPGSICPSDAARAVDVDNWRLLMDATRSVARELATAGDVVITQKGEVVASDGEWRGPIRIRRPAT